MTKKQQGNTINQVAANQKAPGFEKNPTYALDIRPAGRHFQAILGGVTIAASKNAKMLTEAEYGDVIYFPKSDVITALVEPNADTSYCPFKGTASYWSFKVGGVLSEKIAWSYETPYREVEAIKGHLAFYKGKLDALVSD